ncbi:SH3 domain-containing protein [Streptomyces sp. NRRL F-5135]|uniref:SH3 domain-containing protein n=1 Tax=Streptomyces sp. NRRL F-5135 TaxID=1463858 RepID=UPI00131C2154|nr:SH3 domain-containing protein [Streptomyces sp. NRRL F-5135]
MTSRAVAILGLTAVLAGTGAATATAAQAAASIDNRCYITASAANIRSKPTINSTAVGVAYKGWSCTVRDYKYPGGVQWAKVTFPRSGVTGWVRDDLIHTPGENTPICLPGTCND